MIHINSLKPPRINSNLISVISMIVICAMLSVTCLPVLANDCETEREDLRLAHEKVKEKSRDVAVKKILLALAFLTGNPVLIWIASKAYDNAREELLEAGKDRTRALLAFLLCELQCENDDETSS